MDEPSASSSQQQFITQQPMPEDNEEEKRKRAEGNGDTCDCPCVCVQSGDCCSCCVNTGETSTDDSAACCLGIFACNECGCCEDCHCGGCDGCDCGSGGGESCDCGIMEEQSATTSQPQLITQQPLPQAIPDSTAPKSTVAATCCTEMAACCAECCVDTGNTSSECSMACCLAVFACNECGCWEVCCDCCCRGVGEMQCT
ncbi:hypothetical protein PRIPAC_91801 [Pristionchus pacificus]|uniref:Uncharacterized protein n=1 Tax=Pristionchus pacificus TaxID=54126 RepID=A0A2A6BQL6_PRIPA|nr:hypothetical protein PRIPAC_91801 [Pristionchus pacificus]|eukprot:PDM68083.1 hypothetical protein PRIPAC_46127 [Pristionchus pacificus]